jgi:hypothetical protein
MNGHAEVRTGLPEFELIQFFQRLLQAPANSGYSDGAVQD